MKKLFTVIAMMLIVCGTAMAQNEKRERKEFSQEEMIQHQTDRMAEQLSLTDEQKTAVLELNTKYASKFQGMRPRPQGDRTQQAQQRPSKEEMEKMRTEREETQKAYTEELKTILTEEQYQKYETEMKQMRQRGFQRGGGPRGGHGEGQFHRDNMGSDNGNSTTTEQDNTTEEQ